MEVIFAMGTRILSNPGLIMIPMGLCLDLPIILLCRLTESISHQEQNNNIQGGTGPSITRLIRKIALSFLPEVLFFSAARSFFSNLAALHGAAFGPIFDLSMPDRMISVGGTVINLLPIIAIGIRTLSAIIRQKHSDKSRQLAFCCISLIFLIFLYPSASGFSLYWLLYEMLALVSEILCRSKHASKIFRISLSAAGIAILFLIFLGHPFDSARKRLAAAAAAILCQVPLIYNFLRTKWAFTVFPENIREDPRLFALCSIYLTLLTGILIPSTVIRSAPADFINVTAYYSPLWYILNALLLAAGTFIVWAGMAYRLAPEPVRKAISFIMTVIAVCGTVNYMFFGTDRGIMSNQLVFDEMPVDSAKEIMINLAVLAVITVLLYLILRKQSALLSLFIIVLCVTKTATSVTNIISISKELSETQKSTENTIRNMPEIPLSTEGKNVIVFMLDRAIGYYIPFIMAERPELQKQFDGFTFYPNTISFGSKTNEGAPALFGGYEYTPAKINERSDDPLVQKHNEALRLMPNIFSKAGYKITVIDPPYANYQPISDLSIYSDISDIRTYRADGLFSSVPSLQENEIRNRNRNFFCFSFYKIAPLIIQPTLYTSGTYNKADIVQAVDSMLSAHGIRENFEHAYSVLANLPVITKVTDEPLNTFFTIDNKLPHEPELLQLPDYTLEEDVDNTGYESLPITRESSDGRIIRMTTVNQVTHYHSNMATFILLGQWLDFLRENGVYDNTRILIVADHGQYQSYKEHSFGEKQDEDVLTYNPVLMVKDFGSKGFFEDPRFMTNADVPSLAAADLIDSPINPATGNPINDSPKTDPELFIKHTETWDIRKNNGNTFLPGDWYAFRGDDIFDLSAWEYLGRY